MYYNNSCQVALTPSKNKFDENFRSYIDRATTKKQQARINKRSSDSARTKQQQQHFIAQLKQELQERPCGSRSRS
jgi:hypothetical protein